MTQRWLWSYAIHALIWAVLTYFALYVEAIGLLLPMLIIISAQGIAYLIVSLFGSITELWGSQGFLPWQGYNLVAAAFVAIWLGFATYQLAHGKRSMLLLVPHGFIFVLGVWAVYTRGSVNFTMQWLSCQRCTRHIIEKRVWLN